MLYTREQITRVLVSLTPAGAFRGCCFFLLIIGIPLLQEREIIAGSLLKTARAEDAHASRLTAALAHSSHCVDAEKMLAEGKELRAMWTEASLREAVRRYTEAQACWHGAGRKREESFALKMLGDIHIALGEYTNAREAYSKALALRRELDDRRAQAEVLACLSFVLLYQARVESEFAQILQYSDETLSLSRQLGDKSLEAQALNTIGKISYKRGQPDAALKEYERALLLLRGMPPQSVEAQLRLDIGSVYSDWGDLRKALENYRLALSLWETLKQPAGQASALTNIGRVYTLMGERQQALGHQLKALALLERIGDLFGQAKTLNNLGYVYEVLGEKELALDCYLQALQLYQDRRLNLPGGQGLTMQYIGNLYESLGETAKAQEKYEGYLAIARSLKSEMMEADALNRLGVLFSATGKAALALEHYRRALPSYQKAENRRGQAYVLNNMGHLFDVTGKKHEALEYYRQALPLLHVAQDREAEAQTLFHMARAERELGNVEAARARIESALGIIETLRANAGTRDLRASYFASVHQHYELYIDLLMLLHKERPSEGFDAVALRVNERARARSLLEMLGQADIDVGRVDDPALAERARSLRQLLAAKAAQQMHLLSSPRGEARAALLEKDIRALTMKYDELEMQLKAQDTRYAALREPQALTIQDIQRQVLDEDTILLEFALGEQRSYLWAVTPTTLSSHQLPGRKEIERAARSLYDCLIARQSFRGQPGRLYREAVAKADAEYAERAAELSDMLLGNISGQLGTRRLLIVADGVLQLIPFEALPPPRGTGQDFPVARSNSSHVSGETIPLIVEHEIVTIPSASALAALRREARPRTANGKTVAVLADPVFEKDDPRFSLSTNRGARQTMAKREQRSQSELTRALRDFDVQQGGELSISRLLATRHEADAIMAMAPAGTALKATDFKASRATAMSPELKQYRILHFATHGLLNSKHPELSGIVLSLLDEQGNPDDGFLRLQDIYNLRLPVDLVVLSACNTGLGKDVKGEGLIGLTRGFMYAGAARVVASLWKVDDEATAELMSRFYRQMLKDGMPPAASLRAAQLEVWKQKRWRAPYYWAAFALHGEWK